MEEYVTYYSNNNISTDNKYKSSYFNLFIKVKNNINYEGTLKELSNAIIELNKIKTFAKK